MINVQHYLDLVAQPTREQALTASIERMQGSRILASATDAKELRAKGVEVCDLTVGDYSPAQFRAPESFLRDVAQEVLSGQNQYPPSDGIPELQQAVTDFYARELRVQFPPKSVVICGGARPPIYAIFRCLVAEGESVLYFVPSWNNDYYTDLCGAHSIVIQTESAHGFFPTVEQVAQEVRTNPNLRMVSLNSPLNPCGTVIDPEVLRGICQVIVGENLKRAQAGARPLYLMFDMVYWPLTYGVEFHHPLELVPEIAPWVIYVDAISKWLVGTGLRLGWAVVPPYLYTPIRDFMGHVGGWGPRPVQKATANFLASPTAFREFQTTLVGGLRSRLSLAEECLRGMQERGLPVQYLTPQGAIYMSVQFKVLGKTTPSGQVLYTGTELRRYLLQEARVALVAFTAFAWWEESGWFRISVGAVSSEELTAGMQRIEQAISALR